ncbi:MAG: rod shape-determining protein MreC, partial [Bryobacteraceae bacterium]
QTPSKTLAARVISNGTGSNSATVFIDRGSKSGVESGMAVVTPEGIVGKVIAAYPSASLVLLVTDPTFAAGVVSQKNHVGGTLKGQGHSNCIVDYIQNEQKVDVGEWFYTSGYDRVFPRGFPVGQVSVERNGRNGKEVYLNPSGLQGGVEEVLVVLEGVHQIVPKDAPLAATVHMMLPPPDTPSAPADPAEKTLNTQADQIREAYQKIGQVENHEYGVGSSIPNYNVKLQQPPAAVKPSTLSPAASSHASTAQSSPAPGSGASGKPSQPAQPLSAAQKAAASAPKKPLVEPQRQPRLPLLQTDPADADPSELAAEKSAAHPKSAPPKPGDEKPQ